MREFLRSLSPGAEFCLVVLVCLGYLTVSAVLTLLNPGGPTHGDPSALLLIAYELCCLLFLYGLARVRGWSLSDLGLAPTVRLTIGGVGLFLLGAVALRIVRYVVLVVFALAVPNVPPQVMALSLPVALLLCAVNPLFEEIIVAAYVVRASQNSGPVFAVSISALLRLLYHVYQGPAAALTILPVGILFGAVYWRWRKAWPLIVAHALVNGLSLIPPAL